jgi:hypothetical protein
MGKDEILSNTITLMMGKDELLLNTITLTMGKDADVFIKK